MAVASRYLTITQANLDHNHMYLTECMDLFPEDAVGGADEAQAAPSTVRVEYGSEVVETDIVRDKHIFRRRGWVRQFFSAARVTAGDRVLLEQLGPYMYRVSRAEA
jgi:DNA polymerase III subunit epsilon